MIKLRKPPRSFRFLGLEWDLKPLYMLLAYLLLSTFLYMIVIGIFAIPSSPVLFFFGAVGAILWMWVHSTLKRNKVL